MDRRLKKIGGKSYSQRDTKKLTRIDWEKDNKEY